MKRHLILIRHAKSRETEPGQKDIDRELTESGYQQASRIGRYLYLKELIPEKLLTSHARRALDTAQLIADQLRLDPYQVIENEELYEASVRTLLNQIHGLDESLKSVIIIGHNPAITHICEHLSKNEMGNLPAGSMVHLSFANINWEELDKGTGVVEEIKFPDQIVL
ncbi:MAG: histidine phosphatase family protein [Cyclobacteriaceae bacterium]|nr:histidine phosphatase family protein [Cyclobacteriaceae bacterium]